MINLARESETNRQDLFRETAVAMKVNEAIIEKDFWVCWVLDYLFQESPWKEQLVFKGGTSLSKAYNLIQRFSEDIDLILDWKLLGYTDDEPKQDRSSTKQDTFNKESDLRTAKFLETEVAPVIKAELSKRVGFEMVVIADGQNVLITYPKAFSLEALQNQIRLEIGPLASSIPNQKRTIEPYSARHRPALFSRPSTDVPTITAERTFWEKATILHQEAHRGANKPLPPRYSRHYYDLYRMSLTPICASALADRGLLEDVVRFKMKFYRSPWAKYEEARPGSLKLVPPSRHVNELKADYKKMEAMLFDSSVPSWEEILKGIQKLENQINSRNCQPESPL